MFLIQPFFSCFYTNRKKYRKQDQNQLCPVHSDLTCARIYPGHVFTVQTRVLISEACLQSWHVLFIEFVIDYQYTV